MEAKQFAELPVNLVKMRAATVEQSYAALLQGNVYTQESVAHAPKRTLPALVKKSVV